MYYNTSLLCSSGVYPLTDSVDCSHLTSSAVEVKQDQNPRAREGYHNYITLNPCIIS